jgi:hypothetical protein
MSEMGHVMGENLESRDVGGRIGTKWDDEMCGKSEKAVKRVAAAEGGIRQCGWPQGRQAAGKLSL